MYIGTASSHPGEERQERIRRAPYEEFLEVQERLSDAEDALDFRKAKRAECKKKSIPLADVKRKLGLR